MRVAFLGTPDAAVPALEAFLADPGIDVAVAVTNPDRPAGRGYRLTPPPVKVVAARAGIPVWQPSKAREIAADLADARVDVCAVVAYGALLPPGVLAAGGAGFVNLHFSVLPAWRGAAPVAHTLLAGEDHTGVTCFLIDEGMDTGPVLATERTAVGDTETAGELTARLAELGAPLLVRAVRGLVDGSLTPVPQDHDEATYAPKITADDARLDWTRDAADLCHAVRAFNPAPGAHTSFGGERLKVHRATPVAAVDGGPGSVAVAAGEPVVACGRGALRLEEVQPAGKPRMTGRDFANGYRPAGAQLG